LKQEIKALSQEAYNRHLQRYLPTHQCKKCNSPNYTNHGSYPRQVYFSQTKGTTISVLRLKCQSCASTQIILHPEIVPFKRYCLSFLICLLVMHKAGQSNYQIRKSLGVSPSHIRVLLRQFNDWHKLGLEVLGVSLPPPNVNEFTRQYKARFSYDFMQVISS